MNVLPSVSLGLATIMLMIVSSLTRAGDPVSVGQKVSGSLRYEQVDHTAWDVLLKRYVDTNGYVDYTAWLASRVDRTALSTYLKHLSRVNPRSQSDKDAKLAFWINAYNAVTVHGILREYPTTSIRNHTAKLFGYNIWKDLQLYVGGEPYSLDAIEHQILRKMGEPRIHFAIVCASIGCPRLLSEAYTAADVQKQLDVNAKDFFSRPQNFRYEESTQSFQLSSILSWFGEDFGATQGAQLQKIAPWLPRGAQRPASSGRGRVSFLDYNWNLNDQSGHRR